MNPQAVLNSIAAMPASSFWVPMIASAAWALFLLWPRQDGGGVPYVYGAVLLDRYALAPLVFPYILWAIVVAWLE